MQAELAEDPPMSKFATGAVRSSDALGVRHDLISPIGMRRIAETYAEGAVKYHPKNWEMGMPISDLLNHVLKHIYTYLAGDRDEDDLAHAAWGLFAAMHSEECWPHLNDDLRGPGCTLPQTLRDKIKAHNDARLAKSS